MWCHLRVAGPTLPQRRWHQPQHQPLIQLQLHHPAHNLRLSQHSRLQLLQAPCRGALPSHTGRHHRRRTCTPVPHHRHLQVSHSPPLLLATLRDHHHLLHTFRASWDRPPCTCLPGQPRRCQVVVCPSTHPHRNTPCTCHPLGHTPASHSNQTHILCTLLHPTRRSPSNLRTHHHHRYKRLSELPTLPWALAPHLAYHHPMLLSANHPTP
jgi:hypothetical protein